MLEIFFIAIGLSMDAFAAAICQGLGMKCLGGAKRNTKYKTASVVALFFGGFQALMPLIGYLAGMSFEEKIKAYDHWIAFVLLGIIGGKMFWEGFRPEKEDCSCKVDNGLNVKQLFTLAVATSIDALAVGVSFAFLNYDITSSVILIGVTTFILSFIGVIIGNRFGAKYKNKAEMAGGIALVFIGLKILLEHLEIFPF